MKVRNYSEQLNDIVVFFQIPSCGFDVGIISFKRTPIIRRMIQMLGVAQFVQDDVFDRFGRQHDQPPIQRDNALVTATAPFRFGLYEFQRMTAKAVPQTCLMQNFGQEQRGKLSELSFELFRRQRRKAFRRLAVTVAENAV